MRQLFFLFFLIVSLKSYSQQTKDKIQAQNQKLQAEIKRLNSDLENTRSEAKNSILYLQNLNTKLDTRERLVNNIAKETRIIDDDIYSKQIQINGLNRELEGLKDEYSDILVKSYKNKSAQNKLIFILSSANFAQAYRRVKYLEMYANYKVQQANKIIQKNNSIQTARVQKEKSKAEKEIVLAKEQSEKEILDNDRLQQQEVVNTFKKNEKKIVAEINTKQVERKRLDAQLENIIKEEIKIAKAKAEEEKKLRLIAEKKRKEEEAAERKKQEAIAREEERIAMINAKKEALNNKTTPNVTITKGVSTVETAVKVKKILTKEPLKDFSKTNETDLISENFVANKGKLPWPTEKGNIVGTFGKTEHPALKGIFIENSGVEIATAQGSNARAVFGGIVSRIYSISGGNKAVLIQHGDYYTVYNNIDILYIKQGESVTLKQNIGRIYTQPDGSTTLNFQVWKGTMKQNPASWINM